MEILLANFAGKTRREQLFGREFIVAPLTMIVEGVLNGSQGSLFYPRDEIAAVVDAWNNMPMVVYHPTANGKHTSARSPQILEKYFVGNVYGANLTENRLTAEGWFDVERLRQVDLRVLNALEAGEPLELSTGLFTDNEQAPQGATFNGVSYTHTARRYRPDHLAILPDQTGACSLRDGCGVLANGNQLPESVVKARKTFLRQMAEFLGLAVNDSNFDSDEQRQAFFGLLATGGLGQKSSGTGKKAAYTPPKGSIYSDVPRAGNNTSVHDTEHAKSLVSRLDTYEQTWINEEHKNPKASEKHLHGLAMQKSGLTEEGLNTARGYAGKKASMKPGVFYPTANESNEDCPHCGAKLERGDNGKCNRCGKDWPATNGGPGSGNFGHGGRPGEQGGSSSGSGGGPVHGEARKGLGHTPHSGLEDLVEISTVEFSNAKNDGIGIKASDYLKQAGITPMGSKEGKSSFKLDPDKLKKAFADANLLKDLTGNERQIVEAVAKAKGLSLPEAWIISNQGVIDMAKLTEEQRSKIVTGLCVNCNCQTANIFTAEDAEMLKALPDERLISLNKLRTTIAGNELVVNSAREVVGDDVALNAMPQALKDAMARKEEAETEDEPTGNVKGKKAPVAPLAKPLTDKEFFEIAPPGVKATFNRLAQIEQREKSRLIGILTANVAEESKESMVKLYQSMPVDNLELMVSAMPPVSNHEAESDYSYDQPSYVGLGGVREPIANRRGPASDADFCKNNILLPPTINWNEDEDEVAA